MLWNTRIEEVLVLWSYLSLDQKIEFLNVKVFGISKAPRAIAFVTVKAEEAVFVSRNNSGTSHALHSLLNCIWSNHTLSRFELSAILEPVLTVLTKAKTKAFLRSSESHQMLC